MDWLTTFSEIPSHKLTLCQQEQVAITDLMKDFEDQTRSMKDNSKPSFAVVVKLPCLAVKYPQSPGFVSPTKRETIYH